MEVPGCSTTGLRDVDELASFSFCAHRDNQVFLLLSLCMKWEQQGGRWGEGESLALLCLNGCWLCFSAGIVLPHFCKLSIICHLKSLIICFRIRTNLHG